MFQSTFTLLKQENNSVNVIKLFNYETNLSCKAALRRQKGHIQLNLVNSVQCELNASVAKWVWNMQIMSSIVVPFHNVGQPSTWTPKNTNQINWNLKTNSLGCETKVLVSKYCKFKNYILKFMHSVTKFLHSAFKNQAIQD